MQHGVIVKHPRLFRHHVVLGRGVVNAVDLKSGGIPLTQAFLADLCGVVAGVAPEEQVLHRIALGEIRNQRVFRGEVAGCNCLSIHEAFQFRPLGDPCKD